MEKTTHVERYLESLQEILLEKVCEADHSGRLAEGTVLTSGPAPYRRLDCDGFALAYLRVRPRKRAVRVDVSAMWRTPRGGSLRIPSAGSAATLLVKTEADLEEAVEFLTKAVEQTRRLGKRV